MNLSIKVLLSIAVLFSALKSTCASPTGDLDTHEKTLSEVEASLAEPLLKITTKLMQAADKEGKNVILSPISIHCALSMVLLGSDDESLTQKELISILGHKNGSGTIEWHKSHTKLIELFESVTKDKKTKEQDEYSHTRGAEIQMLNMAIAKSLNVEPTYSNQLNEMYKSPLEKVESKEDIDRVSTKVNTWAKDAGFNSDLLRPDQFQAYNRLLMLVSAIKLQAYWDDEFGQDKKDDFFYNYGKMDQMAKDATVLQKFDISGTSYIEFTTKSINPNYRNHIERIKVAHPDTYKQLSNFEFRAIKVPMQSGVSFTIIEPLNNGSGNELADLERQLWNVDEKSGTNNFIDTMEMIDSAEAKTRLEYIEMPGYEFESDIDLKQLLESIGVKRIFSSEAELTKIGSPKMYVDEAKHKAMIEVNKQGIKAAGATIMILMPTSLPVYEMKIKVNIRNPYLFVIRYGKLPLFVGHLVHLNE